MTLPQNIIEWLYARGITDTVIAANGIDWNGTHIVIPVKDVHGTILFNKYRRDPFGPSDQPKYKYQTGTTAQFFNAHKLKRWEEFYHKDTPLVIVCEGEMDAMRLESAGYLAVTTTGGAGTFHDEWFELLKGFEIYVCYDNDEAGVKGAVKLLTKINAKMIMVPRAEGVKDITDYMKIGGNVPVLLDNAQSFSILSEGLPEFKGIGDREDHIRKYRQEIDALMKRVRDAKNKKQPHHHIEMVIHFLMVAIDNLEREVRRVRRAKEKPVDTTDPNHINDADIARAKEVPIADIYAGKLRRMGNKAVGTCPFHDESTASFTIYLDQNKFYCYGCSAGVDVIDFVMKRDGCDFLTAVRTLLNKQP